MLLGSGFQQEIDVYRLGWFGFVKSGKHLINSQHSSIWLEGREDIWKQHGVWNIAPDGSPVVLRDDYFSRVDGHEVHFNQDYFKPFANRFAREIRSIDPDAVIFLEEIPNQTDLIWNEADADNVVSAAHWYDNVTLIKKSFLNWFTIDVQAMKPVFGKKAVRKNFANQVANTIRHGLVKMNHIPTVIGEVGIPFDLHNQKAYRTGDDRDQVETLDTTMYALESNFANFTLWNYTADNTNLHGDQWNDEDLSIFSCDQKTGSGTLHDGGRALRAAVRPYPTKIAGDPISMRFDIRSKEFTFSFKHLADISAPTEIFIPELQYPHGIRVTLTDGTYRYDARRQQLIYQHTIQAETHTIRIRPEQYD